MKYEFKGSMHRSGYVLSPLPEPPYFLLDQETATKINMARLTWDEFVDKMMLGGHVPKRTFMLSWGYVLVANDQNRPTVVAADFDSSD